LVAGVAAVAGCSSPSDSGGTPEPPTLPPPGFAAGANPQAPQQTQNPLQGAGGTSGQTASSGTAGTESAPPPPLVVAMGGSGGAPAGAGGGTGAGGATNSPIPRGTGDTLAPAAGFIAGTSNGDGIQGYFYTFSDATQMPAGATQITPPDFSKSTGSAICVSGMASQVMNGANGPDYTRYYGGGVGLNLADPGNSMTLLPWDRGSVTGFSFNITGMTVPADLRFKATFFQGASVNTDYCLTIKAGQNTVKFEQIVNACYTGGAMAPALAPTAQLQAIQWQVATNTTAATPFNFCVDNLVALKN